MSKFDCATEIFESKFVDRITIVRLMPQALDIATKLDAGTDFHSFLNSVNDSEEVLGYVQINGSEWDSQIAVEELAAFISKDAEP